MQYPRHGVQAYFEGPFISARNASMCEFMGSDATLYVDRGRYEIHPERRSKLKPSELVLGEGPRGADFYDQPDGELLHLANWIECIRTRQKPSCPAEAGVSAASAAHFPQRGSRPLEMSGSFSAPTATEAAVRKWMPLQNFAVPIGKRH
jgi:hypothetical protein